MSPILAGLGGISIRGLGHFGPVRDTGAMFPLQVITVGAAGASSVTFTNIPTTGYAHLQIRGIAKFSGGDGLGVRVGNGSIDTGSNYAVHVLQGDGSSASAGAASSQSRMVLGYDFQEYGPFILDILDYANTNKYKTFRALSGDDRNGSGNINLRSGLWQSTSAINQIRLYGALSSVSFSQYSQFALYGVKSA